MKFYLGCHQPNWVNAVDIPWFVSVRRLLDRKARLHPDRDWMMDSGGFTELENHGRYTIHEDDYLRIIDRFRPRIAFCQDWMCEPFIVAKTGLSIMEHQERTLESYLSMDRECQWMMPNPLRPVLQGYAAIDYVRHVEMYRTAGVSLQQLYGVGSVCRRNKKPDEVLHILRSIRAVAPSIKLHGFGLKIKALSDPRVCRLLDSADSMAWSTRGRNMTDHPNKAGDVPEPKLCSLLGLRNCPTKTCANCMEWALLWRRKVLHEASLAEKVGELF